MAERYTAITGKQIKAAAAGDGLQKDASQNFAIDVSDFVGKGIKDDGSENLDLDINSLDAAVVDVANDSIAILDADDDGSKKESIADFVSGIAGTGLVAASGALSVDLDEVDAAVVDVANDSIAILDADDNGDTKKESIADLATAMAGDGLTATNGVLSVDVNLDTAVLEADVICNEIPTGDINGANTDYELANTPETGTVQVYLNGSLQAPGSGKDYQISGTTITFAEAPDTGDVLLVSYIKQS